MADVFGHEEACRLQTFMRVVNSFLNQPYRWAGDDPSGFDCSGLVVEGLRAVGYMGEKEDLTANGLFHKYYNKQTDRPRTGCLAFRFNNTDKAVHVVVCLDEYSYIGADGGGSRTLTVEDAWRDNAFVKIRQIENLGAEDRVKFVNPWSRG